ncbi:MAG: hypothetical protein MUE51_10155 [Thermoleophilia bacterium]|jgi:hypothetical protein|nr:hypothetical protein [Thermoleophilia bacterium]
MTAKRTSIAILASTLALAGAGAAQAAPAWLTGGAPMPTPRSAAPWAGQHLQLRLMQRDAVLAPLAAAVKSTPAAIRLKARTEKKSLAALYPGVDVVALLKEGIVAAKVTIPAGATADALAAEMASKVPAARMGAGRMQGQGRRGAGRMQGQGRRGGGQGTCRASA